jgi:pimeloyl-ACP methyl ester carboxylesterase
VAVVVVMEAATAARGAGQTTAENLTVEAANGISYAYRRFGEADSEAPPLLFLQHFRGNLDNWDPLLVDTIAEHREVILLDNTGVGLSSGIVPPTVTEMARDAISFGDALGLTEIDLLGYSLGGMVAQDLTLLRPRLVRRLVLAGTGPRGGGELMHGWAPDVASVAMAKDNGPDELLWLFFEHTETSKKLGREYLARAFGERKEDRDKPNGDQVTEAQYDAVVEWGIPDRSQLNRLAGIRQPTLVANGDNDTMIPTINSHLLGEHLPNARVRIFPDAGHGFLFQWPVEFAEAVTSFLDA